MNDQIKSNMDSNNSYDNSLLFSSFEGEFKSFQDILSEDSENYKKSKNSTEQIHRHHYFLEKQINSLLKQSSNVISKSKLLVERHSNYFSNYKSFSDLDKEIESIIGNCEISSNNDIRFSKDKEEEEEKKKNNEKKKREKEEMKEIDDSFSFLSYHDTMKNQEDEFLRSFRVDLKNLKDYYLHMKNSLKFGFSKFRTFLTKDFTLSLVKFEITLKNFEKFYSQKKNENYVLFKNSNTYLLEEIHKKIKSERELIKEFKNLIARKCDFPVSIGNEESDEEVEDEGEEDSDDDFSELYSKTDDDKMNEELEMLFIKESTKNKDLEKEMQEFKDLDDDDNENEKIGEEGDEDEEEGEEIKKLINVNYLGLLNKKHEEISSLTNNININCSIFVKDYFRPLEKEMKLMKMNINNYMEFIEEFFEIPYYIKFFFNFREVLNEIIEEKKRRFLFIKKFENNILGKKLNITDEFDKNSIKNMVLHPMFLEDGTCGENPKRITVNLGNDQISKEDSKDDDEEKDEKDNEVIESKFEYIQAIDTESEMSFKSKNNNNSNSQNPTGKSSSYIFSEDIWESSTIKTDEIIDHIENVYNEEQLRKKNRKNVCSQTEVMFDSLCSCQSNNNGQNFGGVYQNCEELDKVEQAKIMREKRRLELKLSEKEKEIQDHFFHLGRISSENAKLKKKVNEFTNSENLNIISLKKRIWVLKKQNEKFMNEKYRIENSVTENGESGGKKSCFVSIKDKNNKFKIIGDLKVQDWVICERNSESRNRWKVINENENNTTFYLDDLIAHQFNQNRYWRSKGLNLVYGQIKRMGKVNPKTNTSNVRLEKIEFPKTNVCFVQNNTLIL